MESKDRCELIRVTTRALGLLIPLIAVSIGIFMISDIRDILIGGLIGALGTAAAFYYDGKT